MSQRIGLTGGVASGKSLAADILAGLGAKVLDADHFARELVAPGHANLQEIVDRFGRDIVDSNGHLDRPRLRQLIFADPAAKRWLEELLHPQIRQRFLAASAAITAQEPDAVILWVLPLLVESGYPPLLDGVLLIDCPAWLQQQRLAERGWSAAVGAAVIAQQVHPEERRRVARWIIPNLQTPQSLRRRLEDWWQHLQR
ncbi:dephospho-CoA kinase [Candidatus Igneacidithiobacillus taiwanensis]|uniref:dephospho-CoA kinase n=1 Tax=Candidatus Igneacidithiobacillus taiwanensis TaxID=1945924 RepID=UPI002896623C|nr:dephospho-CoA kinase [Candidatus Igneacidithiobacillus taiwanensis]MCE5359970.1 dephospho-CoA kinase [Acidithiobacillus sp.]